MDEMLIDKKIEARRREQEAPYIAAGDDADVVVVVRRVKNIS